MMHSFGPGVFPDCALAGDGRGALIVREGDPRAPGYVRVYSWLRVEANEFIGLHEVEKFAVASGSPAFPRVIYSSGLLWCAYHDGDAGHLHCLGNGHHERLDPCENNEPIVFGLGTVAWQGAAAHGWPITLLDLASGEATAAGNGQGTGLAYIHDSGRVVTVDENRMSVPGLVNPVRAGSLTVGEDPDPNNRDNLGVVWKFGDSIIRRLWADRPSLTPRAAAGGPFYAVTTWGQGADVRLFVGTLSELITASVAPEPIPDPEEPVSIPNRKEILDGLNAQFPHLIAQNTPETVREFYWRAGWALHQADPNFGWLSKTRPENGQQIGEHYVSVDAFAYKGSNEVVDALSSAGDGPGTGGISWGLDERRPSNVWVQPVPFPGTVVTPPPPSGKHAYDGGDNDTGECDVIVKGVKCNQPPDAPIHAVQPGPDPDPEPEPVPSDVIARLTRLESKMDRMLSVFRV